MSKKIALQAWEECMEPLLDLDSIRWTEKVPKKWINLRDFTAPVTLFSSMSESMMVGKEFLTEESVVEAVWPIKVGVYFANADFPTLHHMRTVNPKDPALRGRFFGKPKHLVEWTIGPNSRGTTTGNHRGLLMRHYLEIGEDYRFKKVHVPSALNTGFDGKTAPPDLNRMAHQLLVIGAGIQLTLRYEWTVEIQLQSGFTAAIPGSPEMCRSILALRDIPEGYSRRAALRHLVSAHTRRPDTPVREHLRGRTEFEWNTIRGCVVPSEYDLERLGK